MCKARKNIVDNYQRFFFFRKETLQPRRFMFFMRDFNGQNERTTEANHLSCVRDVEQWTGRGDRGTASSPHCAQIGNHLPLRAPDEELI